MCEDIVCICPSCLCSVEKGLLTNGLCPFCQPVVRADEYVSDEDYLAINDQMARYG